MTAEIKDYRGATQDRYEVSCGLCEESFVGYRATKQAAIDLANRHWFHDGGVPAPVSVWDRMAVGGVKEVYQVAYVAALSYTNSPEDTDARLIAAAPDLLAHLTALVRAALDDHDCVYCGLAGDDDDWVHTDDCLIPGAEETIAKATGTE